MNKSERLGLAEAKISDLENYVKRLKDRVGDGIKIPVFNDFYGPHNIQINLTEVIQAIIDHLNIIINRDPGTPPMTKAIPICSGEDKTEQPEK